MDKIKKWDIITNKKGRIKTNYLVLSDLIPARAIGYMGEIKIDILEGDWMSKKKWLCYL